jgi:hypothetical protein
VTTVSLESKVIIRYVSICFIKTGEIRITVAFAMSGFLTIAARAGPDFANDIKSMESSNPCVFNRQINTTNPDFNRFIEKNSKNIEELLKWTHDEFDPYQYSSKISDPEALRAEISTKCRAKLDEEWAKFGFFSKNDEQSNKICIFDTMQDEAVANLKIEVNGQDLTP